MTRDTAWQMLTRHVTNQTLLRHSLATEATMRALAQRLGGDVEEWRAVGLLHDADYEKAKGHPEKHGLLLSELEPNSIPLDMEQAIKAHNYEETHILPENKMDWAITCCDELTGIITELAAKTKEKKLANITSEMVMQKLNKKDEKEKNIFLCEVKLEIPLQDFVTLTLSAMQQIAPSLGL